MAPRTKSKVPVVLFSLVAFAGFSIAQGTLIWSIVGAIGAVLAAIFGGYSVIGEVLRNRRLRDPFEITYLIPKRDYPEVLFEGARSRVEPTRSVGNTYPCAFHLPLPAFPPELTS